MSNRPNEWQHRNGNLKIVELSEAEVFELWLMATGYIDMLHEKYDLQNVSSFNEPIKQRVVTVEQLLKRLHSLKWIDATKRNDDYWNNALHNHKKDCDEI